MPKQYQHRVAAAQDSAAHRVVKAAVLSRLAKGGEAADLDALQIALTGIVINDHGTCEGGKVDSYDAHDGGGRLEGPTYR